MIENNKLLLLYWTLLGQHQQYKTLFKITVASRFLFTRVKSLRIILKQLSGRVVVLLFSTIKVGVTFYVYEI